MFKPCVINVKTCFEKLCLIDDYFPHQFEQLDRKGNYLLVRYASLLIMYQPLSVLCISCSNRKLIAYYSRGITRTVLISYGFFWGSSQNFTCLELYSSRAFLTGLEQVCPLNCLEDSRHRFGQNVDSFAFRINTISARQS